MLGALFVAGLPSFEASFSCWALDGGRRETRMCCERCCYLLEVRSVFLVKLGSVFLVKLGSLFFLRH